MDELRAISTFVRAAELGSFNKVAQVQGTTPQAVSKTIRHLEHHLGVRLIHRTTRRSSLTEEGQRLFESVRGSLSELVAAVDRAKRAAKDDEGVIRVSARSAIGRRVLMPLVVAFRQLHPAIEFDLHLEERDADPVGDRIDVSFVVGEQPTNQIIARRLFPVQQVVCASPRYLDAHSVPQFPAQLDAHRCIGYRHPATGKVSPWDFVANNERIRHSVPLVLCSSDPEAQLQAVLTGIGIGRVDSITAAESLRSGKLTPLLTEWESDEIALYLCYAQRADMPARVRLFVDFAVARLMNNGEFTMSRAELGALSRCSAQPACAGDRPFGLYERGLERHEVASLAAA
jgi:DNA-binding transcriptional LysR family regulator